jgi:Transposase
MDGHNPYRYMVHIAFPHAMIVTDAFHLHRRVLDALTAVRRSAVGRLAKRRPAMHNDVKAPRFALARARDEPAGDPTERSAPHRAAVAELCAKDPPLALAYELKEAFRAAMAIGRSGDVDNFIIAIDLFDTWCRTSKLAPLRPSPTACTRGGRRSSTTPAPAEPPTPMPKPSTTSSETRNAKPTATAPGRFRAQIIWTFGEVVDPDTSELLPLRTIPRGQVARYQQPKFAGPPFPRMRGHHKARFIGGFGLSSCPEIVGR